MAGGLRSIGELVSEVIARQGYGDFQARGEREAAWREVLDDRLHPFTSLGKLSRGTLQVTVADAVTMQELAFLQTALLAEMQSRLPEHQIRRLSLRIGPLDGRLESNGA